MLNVEDALCAQTDPDMFFPRTEYRASDNARRVCVKCPLMDECLTEALNMPRDLDHGIWGGTTVTQRRRIRRKQVTKEHILNLVRQEFSE